MNTTRWTLRFRLLLVATIAAGALAALAAAQPTRESPASGSAPTPPPAATSTTTTQTTSQNTAVPRPIDPNVMDLIKLYAYLLVGFPFLLFALDIVLAYGSIWTARAQLMAHVKPGSLTDDQLKRLTADVATGPPGIAGLTRAIIAFVLLLIIGVAMFHLVVAAPFADKVPDSVDRILTLLAGALTSITGFYFGSKSATDAQTADAKNRADDKVAPAPDRPTGSMVLDPPRAKAGESVSITGGGFGANRGTITFGSTQADDQDILAWTDSLIKVRVPAGARPGQMNLIVTKDDGHQLSTPPTAFTVLE